MLAPPPVSDVMNRTVETVTPETAAFAAVRRLHENDVGSLVVVADDELVGILTESDVVALVASERDFDGVRVSDVMSSPVHTVDADEGVVAAAALMRDHRVRKLPVCENGDLVGILTATDVSNFVPHVQHVWEGSDFDEEEAVRRTSRQDTAYEKADWEFEYVGHEDAIDVGDVVRFSKPLSDGEIEAFADASGDTNRLHLDDEYAAGTRFGRRIVHGTLVAGVVSAALARLPGLVIYLSQEISYLGPVDVGERVTAECEVVEDIGRSRYRLATVVRDSDGETVIDGEAVVIADPIPESA